MSDDRNRALLDDASAVVDHANADIDRLLARHPYEQRTLIAELESAAAECPDRTFLVTRDEDISYAQMRERVIAMATGLHSVGVSEGDAVLLMLPNGADFVVTWLACSMLGAVQVPVNTAYRGHLLEHVVQNSGARAVVVAPTHSRAFVDAAGAFSAVEVVITTGEETTAGEHATVAGLMTGSHPEPSMPDLDPAQTAAVLYSSGTTGASKGILLSHHYFWFHAKRLCQQTDAGPADRFYTCLPLFHANAQVLSVAAALVARGRVIVDERFSASRFWDRLRESGATRFNYIGGMIPILLKQAPRSDDRDHDVAMALGAAAPVEDFEVFERRFGVSIIESYGQTENCVALSNPSGARSIGSIGLPVCGFDVDVVGADDLPVPTGVHGELVFRPRHPNIMTSGYHLMPEATVEATRNLWFHSGDLVFRDDAGYVHFVDRKKDAIRRRGENISAYEVELVVNSHPDVLESAAFAVPSDVGEDDVMVAVVARPETTLDPLSLLRHCEPRMPYFALPRYVAIRDELPKTPTHRVEKYKLRAEGISATTWDRDAAGYEMTR